MATSLPGWYLDPYGQPDTLRYWDGSSWTSHSMSGAGQFPPAAKDGVAIAAMVLGIVSVLLFWLYLPGIAGGLLGVIYGIQGLKSQRRGMALAGIITGSVGLLLTCGLLMMAFYALKDPSFMYDMPSDGFY